MCPCGSANAEWHVMMGEGSELAHVYMGTQSLFLDARVWVCCTAFVLQSQGLHGPLLYKAAAAVDHSGDAALAPCRRAGAWAEVELWHGSAGEMQVCLVTQCACMHMSGGRWLR